MRYKINTVSPREEFKPFEITFRIETPEEYRILHDQIACKISRAGDFIGDVYKAGHGTVVNATGEVPLKVKGS